MVKKCYIKKIKAYKTQSSIKIKKILTILTLTSIVAVHSSALAQHK